MFRPNAKQFSTQIRIKNRIESDVNGEPEISHADANPALDFCNWKGKGGTEGIQGGIVSVTDTAELVMWYRNDLSERDLILRNDIEDHAYEVINVENVEMRNMYMIVKVRRVVNA